MNARDVVSRSYTIDDSNEDMWEAIDIMRKEKDQMYALAQSQKMGMDIQRKMHANNPMQLKMLDNQVNLQEQNARRMNNMYDSKIQELNRLLDAKKVRDQELLERGLENVQNDVANLKIETSSLAGQINLLKQEAHARKKEFDSQIDQVRSQVAKQEEWSEDIYSQVYSLQANSQLLMAEYEEKQQNLREKQYIEADPNTNAFYKKVFSKMNEVFVATKAIKSGMVSRSQYSAGDKAAGMITLVGSLIPLPAAATVLGYVSKGVQYISDKREGERINNITSNALGFSEMDEICDWLSRGLVFAYEEQIRALTTEAADQFAECCVVYILDFLARTEDEKTAAAEAREASTTQSHPPRPLTREASSDTIGANNAPTSVASTPVPTTPDEVTATTPTEKVTISPREALVSDLLIYMSNRQGVKNGKYGFKDIELKTRIPGLVFTDRGIIKQSGLRTIHGTVYHAPPPPPPPPTSGDPLEQVERGIRRGVQKGLREPREKSRDPKSPNMQRTPSIGARLFRWGQAHSNPLDAVKTYGAAKEEAAATALDMSLKFKEVFGAVISGEEPCRPDIYGYRLGTQREATELGLFQVASRTVSRVVPLSAEQLSRDPTAQSKFWTGK